MESDINAYSEHKGKRK